MKGKLLKALWWLVRNAPAIVEAVKSARDRHPREHKEKIVG
jgi:hypothetical protein